MTGRALQGNIQFSGYVLSLPVVGPILPPSKLIFPCIVRPKRNAIIDLKRKGDRGERGEKVIAEVSGEDRTRAPLLVKTVL